MKALFADLSERARQRNKDIYAYKANERRQVLALCDAIEAGRLRPGDNVAMCGFGAGLTWGTAIFQWGVPSAIPSTGRSSPCAA